MKKILIPCDFSDASDSALEYAAALSKYMGASLVLLHVDQVPVMSPELNLTAFSMQDMKHDSLDALKNLAGKLQITHALNTNVEYHAEIGAVSDVVDEQVKKLGIDLVVMGITGHGSSFMKNFVGSTSVEVSKKLEVPLIIVPPNTTFKKIQNMVYACDYREGLESSAALIRVKYFATLFSSTLQVLHIVPEGHKFSPAETSAGNFVERTLASAEHKTYVVTEKNVAQGLLNFVNQHLVDMIIIEPRKHSLFHKMFSPSTTNTIAFNSPVPVLTLHDGHE